MVILLMGVSGSGKTTIGRLLAQDLGWPFYDGDDLHLRGHVSNGHEIRHAIEQDQIFLAGL